MNIYTYKTFFSSCRSLIQSAYNLYYLLAPKLFTQERKSGQSKLLRIILRRKLVVLAYDCFGNSMMLALTSFSLILQIIEVCLISLVTSIISFGLPLFRSCSPCPESDPDSGIECPRPPGTYGNYVNVRSEIDLPFF